MKRRKVFIIADLHLDHANIIEYCNRPFSSIKEMNKTIFSNWNDTVQQDDMVYFLGDMAFGGRSRKTGYWLSKLKGKIIFIRGNHDQSKKIKFFSSLVLKYNNCTFLLIHDPQNAPK